MVTHELPSIFAVGDNSVFLDPVTKTMIAEGPPQELRGPWPGSTGGRVPYAGGVMNRDNPALVGVFVLSVAILAAVVIVIFGQGDRFADRSKYVMFFRGSVSGLHVGAPVHLRGVDIGSVKQYSIVMGDQGEFYVRVLVETFNGRIENPSGYLQDATEQEYLHQLVEKGLRAQLESQSMLTGQKLVKIDYFPQSEAVLTNFTSEYPEVPTVPSPGEELVHNVEALLSTLAEVPFEATLHELVQTLNRVDTTLSSLDLGAIQTQVRDVLASMERFGRGPERAGRGHFEPDTYELGPGHRGDETPRDPSGGGEHHPGGEPGSGLRFHGGHSGTHSLAAILARIPGPESGRAHLGERLNEVLRAALVPSCAGFPGDRLWRVQTIPALHAGCSGRPDPARETDDDGGGSGR